jgi:hypothetical protein
MQYPFREIAIAARMAGLKTDKPPASMGMPGALFLVVVPLRS